MTFCLWPCLWWSSIVSDGLILITIEWFRTEQKVVFFITDLKIYTLRAVHCKCQGDSARQGKLLLNCQKHKLGSSRHHKTCILPSLHFRLSPLEIWKLILCQNFDLASHFLKPDFFPMFSPFQFHFQFLFGYKLKTACCSSKITKESVAIQAECW